MANFAVLSGFSDSEMAFVLDDGVLPSVEGHAPEAIFFIQTGTDSLAEDPIMELALSNRAHVGVVKAQIGAAPVTPLVLRGGGDNPWSVACCRTGIWAVRTILKSRSTGSPVD